MIDFSQCVSEETVLVSVGGIERIFLMRRKNGDLLTERNGTNRLWWTTEEYANWTIKPPELDPSTLKPGDTMGENDGILRIFIRMDGDVMMYGLCGAVHFAQKSSWRTWTKVVGPSEEPDA